MTKLGMKHRIVLEDIKEGRTHGRAALYCSGGSHTSTRTHTGLAKGAEPTCRWWPLTAATGTKETGGGRTGFVLSLQLLLNLQ